MLTDIHTADLAGVIIATARAPSPHSPSRRIIKQAQQVAVRTLLRQVMANDARFDGYVLNQRQHPFCLIHAHRPKYYVSFSHSRCQSYQNDALFLALVIARAPCGIDVECGAVSEATAKRFFHGNELSYLDTLNEYQHAHLTKRLWQFKESWIKAAQSTLILGMGIDFSAVMTQLAHVGTHKLSFGWLYVDEMLVALVLDDVGA